MGWSYQKRKRVHEIEPVPIENRIKVYRQLHNLSQEDLAKKIDAHTSKIYKIENRLSAPNIVDVYKLADLFNVEPTHLFFKPGENPPIHFDGPLK